MYFCGTRLKLAIIPINLPYISPIVSDEFHSRAYLPFLRFIQIELINHHANYLANYRP